ncbi:MAG TPA: hypothetical protein VGF76_23205 [Polyangiaceae bacterium]
MAPTLAVLYEPFTVARPLAATAKVSMAPAPARAPAAPLCFSVTTNQRPSGESSICAGSTPCVALLRASAEPAMAVALNVAPLAVTVQPAIIEAVVPVPSYSTYTVLPWKVMLFGPSSDAASAPKAAALTLSAVPSVPSSITRNTEKLLSPAFTA